MTNTTPIAVYGASGHGRVVADIAIAQGFPIVGFIDDDRSLLSQVVLAQPGIEEYRVLGDGTWLDQNRARYPLVIVAIGQNSIRHRLSVALEAAGHQLPTLVHPRSVVSRFSRIGTGSVIMATAVLNACAQVGCGCIINTACVIEHDAVVGDFAHISPNATLAGGAQVGDRSHVGTAATILPGILVGHDCVVGAGAVVNRNVPDQTVVVGVPARAIRNSR